MASPRSSKVLALKITAGILLSIVCVSGYQAQPKNQDALDLVDVVVNEVLDDIASKKSVYESDNQQLQQMVYTRVAPHFNFMRIAQLAMGKNWSTTNDQQKQQISLY